MVKHHLISKRAIHTFMALIVLLPLASIAHGLDQPDRNESNPGGTVLSHQKISDTEGGFTGTLDDGDGFAISVASLGDHDGDGVGDLTVGAFRDDDGDTNRGAVWVLFLNGICLWDLDASGTVGASDLLSLLASWGPCKGCPADFDGDGNVGATDLLALLVNWGPCP